MWTGYVSNSFSNISTENYIPRSIQHDMQDQKREMHSPNNFLFMMFESGIFHLGVIYLKGPGLTTKKIPTLLLTGSITSEEF